MASFNPFARRETHSASSLNTYRVLVPLTWALVLITGLYYSFNSPDDIKKGKKIWKGANKHNTPFSQNNTVTGIYWLVQSTYINFPPYLYPFSPAPHISTINPNHISRILLLLSQLSYVWHLFSKNNVLVTAAANVATHFILNNLFLFAWILLWTRNHFWGAEIILIAHLINQTVTYWRHRGLPAFVHLPAVAGPYAWTLTALFWNGAVAVHSHNLPGRIVANIFIWVILAIGLFDIVIREDYILGYCLSLLSLCEWNPLSFYVIRHNFFLSRVCVLTYT
jgi:hypothetical protein